MRRRASGNGARRRHAPLLAVAPIRGTLALVESQRGFSLVETIVAAAIALSLALQLLAMTHATALGARRLDGRLRARGSADRLEERLVADAATAWSVFVPDAGVDGRPNVDGHELDFVTEDGSHVASWWAYAFDAVSGRVTRYAYVPGKTAVAGESYDHLTGLRAQAHPVADVGKRSSGVYDPLFARASATDVEVDFGWNPAATGGNRVVAVRLTGDGVDRTLMLSPATAPSRFTVVVKYTPAPASR